MRSTFWPNRIFERQSCQNRHAGLQFSRSSENGALFMKIVENALFSSCGARFGEIAFLGIKVFKFVTLAWNSGQNFKIVLFPWKLYKTLFSGHAEHVLAKSHFWASKSSKSSHWPQILSKEGKQCAFHENCTNALFRSCAARFGQIAFLSIKVLKIVTLASNSLQKGKTLRFSWKLYKTLFSAHASTIWPNRIFERESQNRHAGLQFSPNSENSALFMKIVQNALFRSCATRFDRIAFFSVKVVKIVTLAHKFSSKRENCALFMKIVQNALFRSCRERFGQIAFLSIKVLKFVTLAWNSGQNFKIVRFSWKLCKTLFSAHAEHVLAKSHFWASKFLKSSHWPKILFKTGKQCSFHENCTKRSFQVMRSTFWPNRIFERQSCQNRHAGLQFSRSSENSALFMKIV